MVSRFAPPKVEHPEFIERNDTRTDVERAWIEKHGRTVTLIRLALQDAYKRTPWNSTIVLYVSREDFQGVSRAVSLLVHPSMHARVYVSNRKNIPAGKRVMLGLGKMYGDRKRPWGEPAPIVPGPPPEPSCQWCDQGYTASDGTHSVYFSGSNERATVKCELPPAPDGEPENVQCPHCGSWDACEHSR